IPPETSLRITVNLEQQVLAAREWVQITYEDNGPGVPENFKEDIFKPFFSRRPGASTSTGVGLTFVRRVVEDHEGVIVERGEPGQGVKFILGFPRFYENAPMEVSHVPVPGS